MALRPRRTDVPEEDEPQEAPRRTPYRMASYEHDTEGKRFRSSNVAFSFWSAAKYVLILSLILWWLPLFGQMIAGYVGGRRAGGPWKGVVAAILPVVCIYVVMTGFSSGVLPSHVFGVAIAPTAVATSLRTGVPLIAPYIDFSAEYVGAFVSTLSGASPYGINMYVLTVAFAYVGGVLAEQSRRELEFNSGATLSNTTVLVHDRAAHGDPANEAHRNLLPAMASMFHWPWHHGRHVEPYHASVPSGHRSRHHRARKGHDAWAKARPLVYMDGGRQRRTRALPAHEADGHARSAARRPRRGRPNRSAKPRLSYPEYEWDGPSDRGPSRTSRGRAGNRRRASARSRDQRALRKTKKLMDRDWRGAKNSVFVEDEDGYIVPEYEDEEHVSHHRRREKAVAGPWDAI